MTDIGKATRDIDECFRLSKERALYDAWVAGTSFSSGKSTSNIKIFKSIVKGYKVFMIDSINKSDLSTEQKTSEIQKLYVFMSMVDAVCSTLESSVFHCDNSHFLGFLSAYVNNALRQNLEN